MGQKSASYNSSGAVVAYYDSLDSPPPATATVIDITDSQWQSAISCQYPVSVVNGSLVIPTGPTLAQAQATQSALIKHGFANAVAAIPFTINGTSYVLDTAQTKQAADMARVLVLLKGTRYLSRRQSCSVRILEAGISIPVLVKVHGIYHICSS